MKTEYKNTLATKRKISVAYLELMLTNNSNFTVTDIVKQAKINRGTFYLHFSSKEEVWNYIAQSTMKKFISLEEKFRTFDIDRAPEVIINTINEILQTDLPFFELMLKAGEKLNLIERIKTIILNTINNNFKVMKYIFSMEHFNIVCQYIVGGVLNTYKEWFNKKINCSLEELSTYLSLLIRLGLKGCINYAS